MTIYDQAALCRIANAIGPCLDGRDQGEMLECIEGAAQTYLAACAIAPAEVRDQLRRVAASAAKTIRLLDSLDTRADIRLAQVGLERGFTFRPDYLEDFTVIVRAAALIEDELAKSAPETAMAGLIGALSRIVGHFAGWHRKSTHALFFVDAPDDAPIELVMEVERSESHYSGKFLAVMKACAEPLGIKKKDAAWDKAIRRALSPDKLIK